MALNPSIGPDHPYSEDLFDPYRVLEMIVSFKIASKIHDGTASSFLNAMANLGDNPNMKSTNAVLSSFGDLNHTEQDKVMESPKVMFRACKSLEGLETDAKIDQYWNSLAKWGTEEDREEMSRRNVDRLKGDLEDTTQGVSTRKSAAVKAEAARLLATIPKEGKLFEWTRAMVCKEDSGDGSAAGK